MIANTNSALVTELGRTYPTRESADSMALKLALRHSPSGLAGPVRFLNGAYRAAEGGPVYEHALLPVGWGVREIPAGELARRVQADLRREIDRLIGMAQFSAARAKALIASGKPASNCFVRVRQREASEYRDRARELETQVTCSIARAV